MRKWAAKEQTDIVLMLPTLAASEREKKNKRAALQVCALAGCVSGGELQTPAA